MRFLRASSVSLAVISGLLIATPCFGQVHITELSFTGAGGEFIELTNTGATAIDVTGWRFCDRGRAYADGFSLSSFGSINAGESVILTEISSAAFIQYWSQAGSLTDFSALRLLDRNSGYSTGVLTSRDIVTIYNSSGALVDQLDYYNNNSPSIFPTTSTANSAWVQPSFLGTDDWTMWQLSTAGDAAGSWLGTNGSDSQAFGSPGFYSTVPEPSSYALIVGVLVLGFCVRRRLS